MSALETLFGAMSIRTDVEAMSQTPEERLAEQMKYWKNKSEEVRPMLEKSDELAILRERKERQALWLRWYLANLRKASENSTEEKSNETEEESTDEYAYLDSDSEESEASDESETEEEGQSSERSGISPKTGVESINVSANLLVDEKIESSSN